MGNKCKLRGDEMYDDVPDDDVNAYDAALNRIDELEAALASLIEVADKNSEYLVGETQDVVVAEIQQAQKVLEGGAS